MKDTEDRVGQIRWTLEHLWYLAYPQQRTDELQKRLDRVREALGEPPTVEERLERIERFLEKGTPFKS